MLANGCLVAIGRRPTTDKKRWLEVTVLLRKEQLHIQVIKSLLGKFSL